MVEMTEKFKHTLKSFEKEVIAKVIYDSKEIIREIKTAELTKNSEIANCVINELKLTIKNYDGKFNDIANKTISFYLGFKYDDGTIEFYHLKDWIVVEANKKVENNDIEIVARDYMEKFNIPYKNIFTFPLTLKEYLKEICKYTNVELEESNFPNEHYLIKSEPFVSSESTFREALSQVCGASLTIPIITDENKLKLKWFEESDHLIKDFSKVTEGQEKEYNSIVLGRGNVEDNIFYPNDIENLDNAFRIDNNYILYFDRENTIIPIFERLNGFKNMPVIIESKDCDFTIEPGDIIGYNSFNGVKKAPITKIKIIFNGGLEIELSSPEILDRKTNIKKAGNLTKRIVNTEIAVDKQKQTITEVIKETENNKERINETLRTIDKTINTFKNMNGINLIKNSVMFSLNNENKPYSWNLSEEGTISIGTDSESIDFGGISRHGFELNGKKISQKINVIQDKAENIEKKPYSFSCLAKKTATGIVKIRLYNEMEEHKLEITEELNYKNISIENILPKMNYLILEIEGSEAKFTDVNLIQSTYKGQWTQATDELLSTNVQFDINGMKIFSETNRGDYTTITPYEFSGYSNASGSLERVFGIDKDKTFSTKLEAKEEFTLKPAKIVPKRTGEVQGIAFVEVVK